MSHFAAGSFWSAYRKLPADIREAADRSFNLLREDPGHPSLRLRVGRFWSARIGLRYRALAVEAPDGLVWFWIGNHAEYDRLVGSRFP